MAKFNDLIYNPNMISEGNKRQVGVILQALLSKEDFQKLRADWNAIGGSEAIPLWEFALNNIEVRYKTKPCGLKLPIGTTVRIRPDLEADQYYGDRGANEKMTQYAGKEAVILAYEQEEDCEPAYLLDIDGKFWSWSDQMFVK